MTTAVENPGATRPRGARDLIAALEIDTRLLAMAAALVVIWVGLDILTGGIFLTARNLWNLSVQTSVVGIMATGMVLVIVARHIDLSVGSLLGFVGMIMAVLQVEILPIGTSWTWLVSLAAGLIAGCLIGAFQGWWVAYRAVPAFIVTLGGLLIFRGLAWWITQGRTVAPMDPTFQLMGGGLDGSIGAFWSWVVGAVFIAAALFKTVRTRQRRNRFNFPVRPLWAEALILAVSIGLIVSFVLVMNSYYRPRTQIPQGIPIPVLILIVVAVAMSALTKVTKFGRYVFAIGGNPEAAELGGINVRKVTVMIFVLMGFLAAISGAIQTARLNAGLNSTGSLLELSVIAAAVIGGTSLAGGVGTIAGAILGALIMQSLQSGMILLDIATPMQPVVIGLVLIVAVWLDTVYQKRRR
ncbi:sugar ABC transporter permease [Skermanella stibiiresistens]|uniref:sugar ABC transporter permease n=1 Tax=Skermanella stibiiresistens TaxID=913326 RepID=UPI0004BC48B2|nr:sugar ABC transporter permease [Skermanella stibiiresistens]